MSWLFPSGGQSTGASASASVLMMKVQDWSPLGLTGLTSLQSKGLSRVFSSTTVRKHQLFSAQASLWSNAHIHTWLLGKPSIYLSIQTFVSQVMSLLFNMLSTFVIAFLPRSERLLISGLQTMSTVIWEPKKRKSVTVSIFCPPISKEVMGPGFRKGRGTRDQIANIWWIIEKAREFQKNIYFCFIDYAKAFDRVDHNKLWKILKEMGIPDHLICLLRNLYAGQEVTVRTGHGTTDWFQIGKGVRQRCILSPCLFNLYAEYIMRNAGLEEAQAGIKIAGRNINNFR